MTRSLRIFVTMLALTLGGTALAKERSDVEYNSLNDSEKRVILNKGTERPFTGEFETHYEKGTYLCKRCNAPLYDSVSKFDAHCGWPAFDKEIAGAVRHETDADGRRTEILCQNCDGHLGHVFVGEGFTETNARHCVNSISMNFVAAGESMPDVIGASAGNEQLATFGGGCFWCIEAVFEELEGVISATSGYAGGDTDRPTYKDICDGDTGHAEVVQVRFDPSVISYKELLAVFFSVHDPTTLNRQGADHGTQYRSIILAHDDSQTDDARHVIRRLRADSVFNSEVVTELAELDKFYTAEVGHQEYYRNNKSQGYCRVVIEPKLDKFRKQFKDQLKE